MDLGHMHLALNHIPVIGVIFGFFVLLAGVIGRSRSIAGVGSTLLVFSALVAIPVYLTGEPAEHIAEGMPGVTESVIGQHESAAGVSLALAMISGVFALGALVFSWSRPSKTRGVFVVAALLSSLVAGTAMIRTANLGGQVRHTEIRSGALPSVGTDSGTTERRGRADKDDDD